MNQKLISRAIERLPVPSSVVHRINRIISNPESSATAVAEVLRIDPTLSGKVLKLANSAYIGIPRTVSSLPHAVVLLGIKRIHSIVLTSELLAPFRHTVPLPFSIDRFRRHAVTVAFIAESIAKHLRRYDDALDEHELFSGALLHDIGKLLAGTVDPVAVTEVYEQSKRLAIPFYRAEQDAFSHTILGLHLAQQWQFPVELTACIRGHHTAACFPELHRAVSVIHIADVMAHLLGYALYPDEKTPAIDEAALSAVRLPVERLRVIAEDILKQQDRIGSLLEIIDG
ncbi:MAG: HDOD domain-containing protein [Chitinispirillaceae bacterium]|nr:HDOD domain-containing protein [Chitinispirillaceae bacterium]